MLYLVPLAALSDVFPLCSALLLQCATESGHSERQRTIMICVLSSHEIVISTQLPGTSVHPVSVRIAYLKRYLVPDIWSQTVIQKKQ